MSNKMSKTEIAIAKARIEHRTIVIERAVVRQDVMVPPFNFINQIFQENKWQSMYTCNIVYPRLVHEFYGNLKIVQIDQSFPILKTKVRGRSITVDPALISEVTHIPQVTAPRLPYPDNVEPPSIEDLRLLFDPQRVEEWHEEMKNIPIGWLQSHHRLLARIMMQNLWPLSRNNNLTIRRARFLYAIIKCVPFCLCKHIVLTMMDMLEEHHMGLPYGCLVTRICMRFMKDIHASKPVVKPEGAFGKHIVMKSNSQLHRHMDPEEQVHPAPHAHSKPSAASFSQGPHSNDAVLSALEHIMGQLQSMQA